MSVDLEIPPKLDPLPQGLLEAIQSLRNALTLREGGVLVDAFASAWAASERVARWLEKLERIPKPKPIRRGNPENLPGPHQQRKAATSAFLSFPEETLERLGVLKEADIYRDRVLGTREGFTKEPTQAHLDEAIEHAKAVLRAVASHGSLLTDLQRFSLEELLADLSPQLFPGEWIDHVEREVLLGNQSAVIDAMLRTLIKRYRLPLTEEDRRRARRVSVVAGHAAMNYGQWWGRSSAIAWCRKAIEEYEDTNATDLSYRVSHALRIQAIGYRHRDQPDKASKKLKSALDVAGSDPKLRHIIRNQEAGLLAHQGEWRRGLEIARDLRLEAEDWNDPDLAARRRFTEGVILSVAGKYVEAEREILESLKGREDDHVMVNAFAGVALLYIHERDRGSPPSLDRARESARVLALLAKPRHLRWHLAKAEAVERHLTGPESGKPMNWGNDVF